MSRRRRRRYCWSGCERGSRTGGGRRRDGGCRTRRGCRRSRGSGVHHRPKPSNFHRRFHVVPVRKWAIQLEEQVAVGWGRKEDGGVPLPGIKGQHGCGVRSIGCELCRRARDPSNIVLPVDHAGKFEPGKFTLTRCENYVAGTTGE